MGANSSSNSIKYSQVPGMTDDIIEEFYRCEKDAPKLVEFFTRRFPKHPSIENIIESLTNKHCRVLDCFHVVNSKTATLLIRFYNSKSNHIFVRRMIFNKI